MAQLPLHGVRIVDLTGVWAGPFAALLLADLGAEVIKPENPNVWQPNTRGTRAHLTKAMLQAGQAWHTGYPNSDPGPRHWNYAPTFVQLYRNKWSFTVDIRRPEGLDILRRLIKTSDVVMENSASGTMEKLGVTYDWLKGIRPDIIYVRMPAYGSGPYQEARALGVHLEAVIGHALLQGYRDLDPTNQTAIFAADYVAGTQTALATMMALWHRRRTGRGQLIEVPQAENALPLLAQAIMDWSLNRHLQGPIGNRSIYGAAPCGVYPCRSPGTAATSDDRWIAINRSQRWAVAGAPPAHGRPRVGALLRPGHGGGPRCQPGPAGREARGVDRQLRRLRPDVPPAGRGHRRGTGAGGLAGPGRPLRPRAWPLRAPAALRRYWRLPLHEALLPPSRDAHRDLQAPGGLRGR